MDADAARRFALRVWQVKQGEIVALTVHLGTRLGLYDALRGAGPRSPEEVAADAGVDPRWTREWLRSQAAAGLLEHDDGRFVLTDEAAAVLVDEDSPLYAAGVFAPGDPAATAERVAVAFRSGGGFDYDDAGEHLTATIEAMNDPWARLVLVPDVLRRLDGIADRLAAGIDVVDVGCGAGAAVAAMARAFPASRFTGLDPSSRAMQRARDRVGSLPNVTLVEDVSTSLDADAADLVTAFDCLHDMPRPDAVLADLRRLVRPGGLVLVKDIKTADGFEDQQRNPVLAMMYGLSLIGCLPSGLGDGDGMGLGNQGLSPAVLTRLATGAGFSTVEVHDLDDPVNLYYALRP